MSNIDFMTTNDILTILKTNYKEWNNWRTLNPEIIPRLWNIELMNFNFDKYNLNYVDFAGSNLEGSTFIDTELGWSCFINCNLTKAIIKSTYLIENKDPFFGSNLRWSNFSNANLSNAFISGHLLEGANFIRTNLCGADISNNRIYGINIWDLKIDENTIQDNLIITPFKDVSVSVDNLYFAQFLSTIFDNKNIKGFIDESSKKIVLLLGAFDSDGFECLNKIKILLKSKKYLPVIFDFNKPDTRNLTETVRLIAHLSKFIICDLTNPKSVPHELANIIPFLNSVKIIPIIKENQREYSMFADYNSANISEVVKYKDIDDINDYFIEKIIK